MQILQVLDEQRNHQQATNLFIKWGKTNITNMVYYFYALKYEDK